MPLHPEIAAHLAAGAALGLPPLRAMSAVDARTRADAEERVAGAAVRSTEMISIPVDGGTIAARVYRPLGADGVLPAIVYIHGGGWVLGSNLAFLTELLRNRLKAGLLRQLQQALHLFERAGLIAAPRYAEGAIRLTYFVIPSA